MFYLEIPSFLFGTVVEGLGKAGRPRTSPVVVEKPFEHDVDSARAPNDEIHGYIEHGGWHGPWVTS